MAIGDEALAAGYLLVPSTGSEDAKVKHGAREINRTRDYVAEVKNMLPGNITLGYAAPSGGANGDIYIRIIP